MDRAEQVLDRLIEAVPGGVVHVSAEAAVMRANPAARAFLGYSYDALTERYTQDFAGETWFEDGSPCPPEAYPVSIALMHGRPAGPTTIGVTQPSGEVRWAVFRAVPVEGGGAVVTFLDITERRAAERRVRQSDRLASLGRLSAGLAHEINNPLAWVMLILESALTDEEVDAHGAIADAMDGLQRVSAVVRDLGAFARVDEPRTEPIEVAPAIHKAVSIAGARLTQAAKVHAHAADDLWAMGVETQVVQVLLNLLLNAAQAIPPGAADDHHIHVAARLEGEEVHLEVRDDGRGMSEEVLEHALTPFFTTKAVGEGTGLGLAISHALCTSMGGSLDVWSREGQGTAVTLRLPWTQAPAAGRPPPLPRWTRPGRVLVVDDEPALADSLARALRPHQVDTALNGRQALECIAKSEYDVIVCDLMMPEISGVELHARLAAERPDLVERMVFVTGGAYTDETRAFCELPSITVLGKPFGSDVLRRAVETVLAK